MKRVKQASVGKVSLDDVEDYRAQIARYPRLSVEEQNRLLSTRGGARDAANQTLIEHNLYLVFDAAVARKKHGVAFGDLFQEGTVGLISAVEHYRDSGAGFTASLRETIEVVMDAVLDESAEVQRNDEAFVIACRLLEAAERLLAERLQRPATVAELAQLLHWEESRVNVIREMLAKAQVIHDQELLDYLDLVSSD
jgi:RNA polymerase primary sigma factor